MLEGRHLGEGMARQMRLLAMGADFELDELVRDALFREREAGAPHIGAARRAIDDRPRHIRSSPRANGSVHDAPLAAGVLAGGAVDLGRAAAEITRRRVFAAGLRGGIGDGGPPRW